MHLRRSTRFALGAYSGSQSWLLDRGQRARVISGLRLESQFDVGTHALLFVTYNCPYEETLAIYLLSPEYRIIDQAALGPSFPLGQTGIYRNEHVIASTQVEFSFFYSGEADDLWRISLREGVIDFNRAAVACRPTIRAAMATHGRFLRRLPTLLRIAVEAYRRRGESAKELAERNAVVLLEHLGSDGASSSPDGMR